MRSLLHLLFRWLDICDSSENTVRRFFSFFLQKKKRKKEEQREGVESTDPDFAKLFAPRLAQQVGGVLAQDLPGLREFRQTERRIGGGSGGGAGGSTRSSAPLLPQDRVVEDVLGGVEVEPLIGRHQAQVVLHAS